MLLAFILPMVSKPTPIRLLSSKISLIKCQCRQPVLLQMCHLFSTKRAEIFLSGLHCEGITLGGMITEHNTDWSLEHKWWITTFRSAKILLKLWPHIWSRSMVNVKIGNSDWFKNTLTTGFEGPDWYFKNNWEAFPVWPNQRLPASWPYRHQASHFFFVCQNLCFQGFYFLQILGRSNMDFLIWRTE